MTSVVVGGSGGLGRVIAQRCAARGEDVVITSRDKARAETIAAELGGKTRGLAADLSRPETIAASLADVGEVDHLVITAIEQAVNSLKAFDISAAIRAVTTKLVGYAETVRVLRPHFRAGASVVLFGASPGHALPRLDDGDDLQRRRLGAREDAGHGDRSAPRERAAPGRRRRQPKWRGVPNHPHIPRTPLGRLVTMDEIADATEFLLRNGAVNAIDLFVDGGVRIT